jgi:predicted transcriptional regulator
LIVATECNSRLSAEDFKAAEYKIEEDHMESIFGSLEAQVLRAVWRHEEPVKVRDIYEELKKERKIAYTTVMTTMNNLHEKGILDRNIRKGRGGLLYVYWPRLSRQEVEQSIVQRVLDSLIRNFSESVASYLVENKLAEDSPKKAISEILRHQEEKG